MNEADILIRSTAWIALGLYAIALLFRSRRLRAARVIWSLGWLAMLVHIGLSFHVAHAWSHDAAYQDTARKTFDVVGLDWGGGVYVNYLFTLIWGLDAAWWWLQREEYERRAWWIEFAVQGFLAFVAFNATVVFGHGPIRWIGGLTSVALVIAFVRRR